jgi:hypothetical protein
MKKPSNLLQKANPFWPKDFFEYKKDAFTGVLFVLNCG